MRWGIFWRTLWLDLPMCGDIILAAMLLHNFIIDKQEGAKDTEEETYFERFYINTNAEVQQKLSTQTGERPSAMVSDNNKPSPPGRHDRSTEQETEQETLGEAVQ